MDVKKIRWKGVDCIDLARDKYIGFHKIRVIY
jgi:hypothetical protein